MDAKNYLFEPAIDIRRILNANGSGEASMRIRDKVCALLIIRFGIGCE